MKDPNVVQGTQCVGENLFALVQVVQGSTAVFLAGVAIAPFLNGTRILFVAGIFHVETASITQKQARVAGIFGSLCLDV